MQRTNLHLLSAILYLCSTVQGAQETLLRLDPADNAPVIATMTASEKVILDAAPTPVNAEPWPAPAPAPAPVAIPAPRARVNPDQPIGQLDPDALPLENVVWRPAGHEPGESENPRPVSRISDSVSPISDLIVTPGQTQAREAAPDLRPTKPPRLLTGMLKREIHVSGPGYPVRLKSPEGRLIAYVDFSGIYISDLTPYLDQKVYLRGQIHPIPETNAQLVILAEEIRLAE